MAMAAEAPSILGPSRETLRETFGKALCELADEFRNVVVLDADVASDTGMHHFRKSHPHRFLQFGLAERNMMAAAGGLAAVGFIPIVTTVAVFCLRAVEQAHLSLAYARRNAKIVASHAGLDVGPDGGAMQALEDLAAFRAIAGMTVISPADPIEMALATRAILQFDGPVYMRIGSGPSKRLFADDHRFEIGKGRIIRDGIDVTIVACGVEVGRAVEAAESLAKEGISARVVNMATIKPIDGTLLTRCAAETGAFVTAEDHNIHGGLGSAVAEALAARSPCPIEFVGVKDVFGASAEPEELAEKFGLSARHIAIAAKRAIERKRNIAGRRKNFR
jgi:transketolase